MIALADDQFGMRDVERRVKSGARCVLHAMIRPQGLRAVTRFDRLEGLSAGMGAREGHMPRRVPVLRDDDMREMAREAVDRRHDRVAVRRRERAAGAEIALRIGDDQNIAFARRAFHRIRLPCHCRFGRRPRHDVACS